MQKPHDDPVNIEDIRYLNAAMRYARTHQGLTGTNPSVACIVVKDLGHGPVIVGRGVTAMGGRPHAEPPAVSEAGEHAKGATAYVSLEPCSHHGRTPPCAQTLIDAGIKRVVIAFGDPDSRVDGKGRQMMEKAGVTCSLLSPQEGYGRVMAGYFSSRTHHKPLVTLKLAMTRDGLIGAGDQGNVRISGEIANRQTHLARARHDAILVGSGTTIMDNPRLNCRLPGLENRSPIRIVLDANARLTETQNLVSEASRLPTWVATRSNASKDWVSMLRKNGVLVLASEVYEGHIALPELFDDLHSRGIQSVMVEGGATLAASLLDEELVDEIIIHVGGEPDWDNLDKNPVVAPFTPDELPEGFKIVTRYEFGSDLSLRAIKGAE